jgi:hypothetical protein
MPTGLLGVEQRRPESGGETADEGLGMFGCARIDHSVKSQLQCTTEIAHKVEQAAGASAIRRQARSIYAARLEG